MAAITSTPPSSDTFPAAAIEKCIRGELGRQASDQALLRPPKTTPTWEPEIDSLVVVEIICAVEDLLGVPLPDSFAPRGGYDSVDDCVADLTAAARTVWRQIAKKETQDG